MKKIWTIEEESWLKQNYSKNGSNLYMSIKN